MKFQRTISVQTTGERAIDLLAQAAPELSRQQIKQAMQKGAVWLKQSSSEKRLRRVTQTLQAGTQLQLYYDDNLLAKVAETPLLLTDEKDFSVWIKPAGLLAQGTRYGDHCSLLFAAEQYFDPRRPCHLVHRLDSAASGLMLIAHSPRVAAAFSDMFQKREMTKRYRVTVEGLLDTHTKTLRASLDDKEAITQIETVIHLNKTHTENERSDLIVLIETGRKHQIRRHLAGVGHPVIGDREYGSSFTKEPLQLVAIELSFVCPLTKQSRQFLFNPTQDNH